MIGVLGLGFNMRFLSVGFCALALAGAAHGDTGSASHNVFGVFVTPDGNSHIEISDCGDGSPCGRIVWIDPASLPEGKTPDTAAGRTGEPLMGMQLIEGFERRRKDWRGGSIYDPENDKMYSARLKRLSESELQLKGCIGPVCQTQIWAAVAD